MLIPEISSKRRYRLSTINSLVFQRAPQRRGLDTKAMSIWCGGAETLSCPLTSFPMICIHLVSIKASTLGKLLNRVQLFSVVMASALISYSLFDLKKLLFFPSAVVYSSNYRGTQVCVKDLHSPKERSRNQHLRETSTSYNSLTKHTSWDLHHVQLEANGQENGSTI